MLKWQGCSVLLLGATQERPLVTIKAICPHICSPDATRSDGSPGRAGLLLHTAQATLETSTSVQIDAQIEAATKEIDAALWIDPAKSFRS